MKNINKSLKNSKNNISPKVNSQMPASKTRKPKEDKLFKQQQKKKEAESQNINQLFVFKN